MSAGIVPAGSILEPGLYIGLDESKYHAAFGLSSHGILHLRMSPLDWWARSPLNPNLADVLEEEGDKEAHIIGRAYDARIVMGKAYFDAHYAPSISPDDYPPGILRTNDDLKLWLKARDLKSSGNKDELIARVLEHDPSAKVWDAVLDGYVTQHEGKEFLSPKLIHKIEIAAAMIEKHPQLGKAFTGGIPQASIVWDCPIIGVRCKARLDYLKSRAIVDLKTCLNRQALPIYNAIAREIGFRRYHIQAAWYLEAASHVARFIKDGRVFGECDPHLLQALAADHQKTFMWTFQMKGIAPVARGVTLPNESPLLDLARAECENAKQTFRKCLDTYGTDPWIDANELQPLDYADIPSWSLT